MKPVQQKLRRLPFTVRDAVSAELKRLVEAGVIERTDAFGMDFTNRSSLKKEWPDSCMCGSEKAE